MEKFCPECGRVYEEETATHCEDDKVRLVVVQDEPDMVGQVLMERYHLEEILGQGGMGTVYLAYQESMGRKVAVKVLRARYARNKIAIKRFHREARAASLLTHPNTITVYDSGQTDDGHLFLVMERLSGQALCDILETARRLSPVRAIRILAQVCDSLSEAHAQGIIHRDLKAENIFIDQKPGNPDHVKVLDFGIAKMEEEGVTQATATGMICGTPSYMSPEQAMGRDLTGAADIYSIGILLYEMLVGNRPYMGDSPMEVMLKQINEPVPQLPKGLGGDLQGPLNAILKRVLAKRPGDRPSDCQQLKMEFMALIGHETPTDPSITLEGVDLDLPTRQRGLSGLEGTGLSHPVGQDTFAGSVGRLNRLLWGTAIGLLVVVIGVVMGVVVPDSTEAPVPSETSKSRPVGLPEAPGNPAAPAMLGPATAESGGAPAPVPRVSLASDPTGATVQTVVGEEVGKTPWSFEHGPGSRERKFVLKLEGYLDRPVTIAEDAAGLVTVMMVKKPPVPRAIPATVKSGKRAPVRAMKSRKKPTVPRKPDAQAKPKHFGTF